MKYTYYLILITSILFLCAATVLIKKTYTLSRDHRITIRGTSNFKSWYEKVEKATGHATMNKNKDGGVDLTEMSITLYVHFIKSDVSSMMSNKTYKALKAEAHPTIVFSLTEPILNIPDSLIRKTIQAKGNLTIAGVTNPVVLLLDVIIHENNRLTFEGHQSIKMTDYSIEPPKDFWGLVKTGNTITLHYHTNFLHDSL